MTTLTENILGGEPHTPAISDSIIQDVDMRQLALA